MTLYQVDAFANRTFTGNPAAVVPLPEWLEDELLQSIAEENNLSETTFYVPEPDGGFRIRWFTPLREVALCGHATLAAAHVLFHHLDYPESVVRFISIGGPLSVSRSEPGRYAMNFPATPIERISLPEGLASVPGCEAEDCYRGQEDFMIILKDEATLRNLKPNLTALSKVDARGLIVTAPADSSEIDFVSRCFFPRFGIDEDPVTGSAHCTMAPYWSARLGKRDLVGQQLSARSGTVICNLSDDGERVELIGDAHTYLIGEISVTT